MKKLFFIPLIIAISGCSNNVSYKTNDGKILIKDETVVIEKKLSREDLKSKLISRFNKQKKIRESNIKYTERNLIKAKALNESRSDFEKPLYAEIDQRKVNETETALNRKKNDLVSYLQREGPIVRSLTETLKDTPKIHANFISFIAIKTDLIGNKAILPRITLTCFNPSLIQKYKTAWSEFLSEEEQRTASNIICDKFGNFK